MTCIMQQRLENKARSAIDEGVEQITGEGVTVESIATFDCLRLFLEQVHVWLDHPTGVASALLYIVRASPSFPLDRSKGGPFEKWKPYTEMINATL